MRIIALFLACGFAHAADIYADAYRFGEPSYTGIVGLQGDHWGVEVNAMNGDVGVVNRQYLAFKNIEIGARFEIGAWSPADGSRTLSADIHATSYLKVGSDIFGVIKLDESNKAVLSVGFKLY